MRNLTKKALSLMLCLLLVISALSGAFSIYAEEVVNDAPLNLDFSDGFNHWSYTDNVSVENGAVTFTEGRDNWTYLQTEKFKIPNLEIGDTVTFSMVITVDAELSASDSGERIRTYFDTYLSDGTAIENNITSFNSAPTSGKAYTKTLTVEDPNQIFRFRLAKANGTIGAYTFSDFKVIVAKDKGATYTYTGSATPNETFLNLDFSDGFAFWNYTDFVAVDNGVATFTDGCAAWTPLVTNEFKLPNLEVGDTVAFSRVVTVINPTLAATANYTNIFRTNFITSADSWANHITEYHASINTVDAETGEITTAGTGLFTNATSGAASSTAITVTDPEQSFKVQLYKANGPAGVVSIANMKIVVTKADGTCLIYTNRTTPFEGYYDGNVVGGTEADGYTTTQAGAVLKYPALSAPTNLDFSQGLKYWGPYCEKNTTTTAASKYARVDENGILTLTRYDSTVGYKEGITSQKFAVSNVAVGDKLAFYVEYNWKDEDSTHRNFTHRINIFATDETKVLGNTTQSARVDTNFSGTNNLTYAPGETAAGGWYSKASTYTVTDADALYSISLAYSNANVEDTDTAIQFRNIRVFKVLSDGAYLDLATGEKVSMDLQEFGGTEEDGIVNKAWEGSYRAWNLGSGDKRIKDIFGTATNLVNGDFSQGFKYWFGGNYNENFPELLGLSDYATVENGVVKLDAVEADANGNTFNPMLFSQPFYIEGIKEGDILKVAVDARNAYTADGSSGIQLQLGELKDHSSSAQYYSTQAIASSSFFTAASETEWTTLYNNNTLTVTDPTHPFYVRITKHVTDAAEFKNIRIYKIDSTTGEITLVNNGYNADANYNKDGGSAEDGMMELGGTYVQNTPAVDKLTNLDFSDGFKYWAPMKGANGFTSDALNIEEDGSVTLTHSGNVGGIQAAPITFAEEYVGKKVSLWLYATHQGSTFEMSYYENGTRNGDYSRSYSGWFNITIPEVVAGAKYNFEIKMPSGGTVNLKDFRLLAHVEHNNGIDSYVDLEGNEFMNYAFDFQPYGGTETDGIIVPSNGAGLPTGSYWGQTRQYMSTNDGGLLNGNFSEGFKYWMYTASESSASDYLTVDKETGVVTYNANCTTQYAGLYSQAFSLKDYVKEDDVIYVAADVSNAPSSMVVQLISYYKDAEGNWSSINRVSGGGSGPVAEGKWSTIYAKTTVRDVNEQFFVKIEKQYEAAQGSFKNIRILKGDKGALKKIVATTDADTGLVTYEYQDVIVRINLDGSLQDGQLYGDANNDGKVNLTDLVRMKKQAAGINDLGIFLAAVDFDADEDIDGVDLVAAIAKVIELA